MSDTHRTERRLLLNRCSSAVELAVAAGGAGGHQVATQRQSWLAAPSLRSLRLYDCSLSVIMAPRSFVNAAPRRGRTAQTLGTPYL